MEKTFRIVHYINQFFAGIGGEDKAYYAPVFINGTKGPSAALQKLFGNSAEIAATIVCGDNYFVENTDKSVREILSLVAVVKPDLFIAGPAFNAGRYGIACGEICKAVKEKLGIPVVTALYPENPAVEIYKKHIFIIPTKNSVAGMGDALKNISTLGIKLLNKVPLGSPAEENYITQGIRKNYFATKTGAERAVEMLLAKIHGQEPETEYKLPVIDKVKPLPPIDPATAKICLITSGGIVPKGNPDHIESSSASRFGKYSIVGINELTKETHQTAHGGYDPTYANNDPNRVLPLDIARELECEGEIRKLYEYYFATVGNGTSIANAEKFAREIAQELKEEHVQAILLTSTWGTCTRCGATMVKTFEKEGIPAVHICTIVPISLTNGANRIIPAVAIPHPLGNPLLQKNEEKLLRKKLLLKALLALKTPIEKQTVFE